MRMKWIGNMMAVSLLMMGCASLSRHERFIAIENTSLGTESITVHPFRSFDFYLFGILIPFIPFFSNATPMLLQVTYPDGMETCPPVAVGGEAIQATVMNSGSECYYELKDGKLDTLELNWKGKTIRTALHKEVTWSYEPFFFPTH